jgi:hypothetical protein
MTTANDILKVARGEIGYKESPANSNRTKYNRWYYGSDTAAAWCAIFVDWVFGQCGAISLLPGGKKNAYVPTIADDIIRSGRSVDKGSGKPGDIVTFDWEQNSHSDHIGIIEKKNADGTYTTIEGNTAVGNDSNSGQVMRRTRKQSQISYIFRPAYGGSSSASGSEYEVGGTYTINTPSGLRVRTGAGTNYRQKKRSELTKDGKKHAKLGTKAVLKNGTRVTCKAIKVVAGDTWMQIPSGWICAIEDGNVYISGGSAAASKPASSSGGSSSGRYAVGGTYTIVAKSGLKVRTGAGTNYRRKKRSELTADGKKHAKVQTYATLKNGTRVTCQSVKAVGNDTWIKIPSGWICAVQGGSVYVK